MNRRWTDVFLFMGFLFLTGLLCAENPPAAEGEFAGNGEITDSMIEERKKHFLEDQQKRAAEIEKQYQERQAFETKMKDERVAFEKRMSDERIGFLDSLKGMKPPERRTAWQAFQQKQQAVRQSFRDQHHTDSESFRQTSRGDRGEFHGAVKNENQSYQEQQRRGRQKFRQRPPAKE